jgi:ABC-type lipoprotein export system ATPase subunit
MKRFSEKVKDIVDVRSYEILSDLLSEPSKTVASYHFSDATTELMVRWLDEICNPVSGAKCRAIAGYRGVGKSHFLAMVSVISSHPEVRSLITETHVASASQRLLRRHYP